MVTNNAVTVTYTFSLLLITIRFVNCHLKNMGEVNNQSWLNEEVLKHRVAGGTATQLKFYAHNVQIVNMGGMCGGTILNHKTVLTAAHCFDNNDNLAEMRVFSNSRYMFDNSAIMHEVWDFIRHEEYKIGSFDNDIAIIIIHDTFKYSPTVKKAFLCITDVWMNEKEKWFYATGWGETKYKAKVSQQGLLEAKMKYVSRENCSRISKLTLHPSVFCLFGDGKRDTCRGDSGGAILWKRMVVGIVSHGSGCANHLPSMYTNVPFYIKWIKKTVLNLHRKFCHSHRYMKMTSSLRCRW